MLFVMLWKRIENGLSVFPEVDSFSKFWPMREVLSWGAGQCMLQSSVFDELTVIMW
jgi:hypothetical protein